jgi:hypothetical protein
VVENSLVNVKTMDNATTVASRQHFANQNNSFFAHFQTTIGNPCSLDQCVMGKCVYSPAPSTVQCRDARPTGCDLADFCSGGKIVVFMYVCMV